MVEQSETTKEAAKRLDDKGLNKRFARGTESVVNREMVGIFTKGTHVAGTYSYEAAHVMALFKDEDLISVCYFDMSTSNCCLGQFEDDLSFC